MTTLAYLQDQLEAAIQDELNARRAGDAVGQELSMQLVRALRAEIQHAALSLAK